MLTCTHVNVNTVITSLFMLPVSGTHSSTIAAFQAISRGHLRMCYKQTHAISLTLAAIVFSDKTQWHKDMLSTSDTHTDWQVGEKESEWAY